MLDSFPSGEMKQRSVEVDNHLKHFREYTESELAKFGKLSPKPEI